MWYDFLPKLLNMSITGGIMILAVLLIRLLMRRGPKVFSYALWAVVLFRLLCPVSIPSPASILNLFSSPVAISGRMEYIPEDIVHTEYPKVNLTIPGVNELVSNILPQGEEQLVADPLEAPLTGLTYLWLSGVITLFIYSMIKLSLLRRKLIGAMPIRENLYLVDHIASPFVIGLFRPKIYLPSSLSEEELTYVILHEQYHIRRLDHVFRILAFLTLCIHWFNPLVWIAFALSDTDMEMSCDEAVMKRIGEDIRERYSYSLLSLATGRRMIAGAPLAFGEGDTKSRIQNVMNYKRPGFWITLVAVIACLVVAVCLVTNPAKSPISLSDIRITEAITLDLRTDEPLTYQLSSADINDLTDRLRGLKIGRIFPDFNGFTPFYSLYVHTGSTECLTFFGFDIDGKQIALFYQDQYYRIDDTDFSNYLRSICASGNSDSATVQNQARSNNQVQPDTSNAAAKEAIYATLTEHNQPAHPSENDIACCSFIILGTDSGAPLEESSPRQITYYGWALYEQYMITDKGLEISGGSHIPVALTFDLDESGYTLTEYWEPGDGSYYEQDIRSKFPPNIVEDGLDSQKYILLQTQECYAQAVESTGLDTTKVLQNLIHTICESPASSSNQSDYIEEHPIEYRELTYYGMYTLKYCFSRFEKGDETGLEGQIMARACTDIIQGLGKTFHNGDNNITTVPVRDLVANSIGSMGQDWYDTFKINALNLKDQYSKEELEEQYPISYLLLVMLGEM